MQRNATQLCREADQVFEVLHAASPRRKTGVSRSHVVCRERARTPRRITLAEERCMGDPALWQLRDNWQFKTSHVRDPRPASAGAEQGFNPPSAPNATNAAELRCVALRLRLSCICVVDY